MYWFHLGPGPDSPEMLFQLLFPYFSDLTGQKPTFKFNISKLSVLLFFFFFIPDDPKDL